MIAALNRIAADKSKNANMRVPTDKEVHSFNEKQLHLLQLAVEPL